MIFSSIHIFANDIEENIGKPLKIKAYSFLNKTLVDQEIKANIGKWD
jgi:hypothetical protein